MRQHENQEWWFAGLAAAILFLCYIYFFPRWADWNQNTRLDLTMAIVEQGTLRIDDYYLNTGDYAVYDGHIYTDKAPGISFLAVPIYWGFRTVSRSAAAQDLLLRLSDSDSLAATLREGGTGLLGDKVYFAAALYAVSIITVALPSALLGGVLYLSLRRLLQPSGLRFVLVLVYGLATISFPYSTVFYSHQLVAVLLFVAFDLLWRIRLHELHDNWLWAVGALLGLAVLTEFPAAIMLLILGGYTAWFLERKGSLAKLVVAGLPFAFLLGWYNNTAFGSPFASSYRYLGLFQEYAVSTNLLGFATPDPAVMWGLTFSPYRGLFFLSPFLLLALPGFVYWLQHGKWRAEAVVAISWITGQLLLVSGWWAWHGGFSIGPRNLIIIVPFLMPAVAYCVAQWLRRPALLAAAWTLVAISFVCVWIASVSGQQFAVDTVMNPLFEIFWPQFRAGDITRNLGMMTGLSSWSSLLPLIICLGGVFWLVQRCGDWSEKSSLALRSKR